MNNHERNNQAQKTFFITFLVNAALMLFKLFAGIFGRSGAMISDAIHTLTDLGTTVIAMLGVKFASKDSDESHPYGHEKIESLAGLLLAVVLLIAAFSIGKAGIFELFAGKSQATVPGVIALFAAAASVLTQGAMFWYAYKTSKRLDSAALLADSYHHLSDALSSVGTFIGIGLARFGVWFADAAASLLICALIVYASYVIAKNCINQLIDAAPPQEENEQIKAAVLSVEGVLCIDAFRCRMHGNRLYVDIEIAVDKCETFASAHQICENVHEALETAFVKILHCTVHANPHEKS